MNISIAKFPFRLDNFTMEAWSNLSPPPPPPLPGTTSTYLSRLEQDSPVHRIQRVQTQSSTRALTGIGAEVNLLIASSQFQVTAHYSEGGGGLDNEPATDKDRLCVYDVVANRDRVAYVIGITRELISNPFDPPPRDDWLTSGEQPANNVPKPRQERTRRAVLSREREGGGRRGLRQLVYLCSLMKQGDEMGRKNGWGSCSFRFLTVLESVGCSSRRKKLRYRTNVHVEACSIESLCSFI